MDLHEDQSKNTVTATFELPGLKKEDVQIDLQNGQLTISGESKISSEHKQEGYLIRERGFGKVSRTLKLPQGIKVGFFCSFEWLMIFFLTALYRKRISKLRWKMES